jgi:hypothetical protein
MQNRYYTGRSIWKSSKETDMSVIKVLSRTGKDIIQDKEEKENKLQISNMLFTLILFKYKTFLF